jgi:hypothetical protein
LETDAPASEESQQCVRDDSRQRRFTPVFDREAASSEFFAEMELRRIANTSDRRYPGEDWPAEQFADCSVRVTGGEEATVKLAWRGTRLSNHPWVREGRKLPEGARQTSIPSAGYQADYNRLAVSRFARRSQENFYKYLRRHYGWDRFAECGTAAFPDPT